MTNLILFLRIQVSQIVLVVYYACIVKKAKKKSLSQLNTNLVSIKITEFSLVLSTTVHINSCVLGIASLFATHKSDKYSRNLKV